MQSQNTVSFITHIHLLIIVLNICFFVKAFDMLKMCQHAPSVQMFEIPKDAITDPKDRDEPETDPDVRLSQSDLDNMIEKNNEFFDSEQDNEKNESERISSDQFHEKPEKLTLRNNN